MARSSAVKGSTLLQRITSNVPAAKPEAAGVHAPESVGRPEPPVVGPAVQVDGGVAGRADGPSRRHEAAWRDGTARCRAPRSGRREPAGRSGAGKSAGRDGGASLRSAGRARAAAPRRSGRRPAAGPPQARHITRPGLPRTAPLYGGPGRAAAAADRPGRPGPPGPAKKPVPTGGGVSYTRRTGLGRMSMHGSSRMAGGRMVGAAILALALAGGPAGAEEWTVKTVPRTDGPGTRCVMESVRQSLSDGYQDTTAYVTVDARSVTVTSASNLDGGFSDIGLIVDQEPLVPMDRLAGIKTAQFDAKYATLGRALQGRRPSAGAAPVLAGVARDGDALGHLQLDRVHQGLRRAGRLSLGGPRRGGRHGVAAEVQPGAAARVPGRPRRRRAGSRATCSSGTRGTRSRGTPA